MSLSVLVSRKTFFRLKGDYAKSPCMAFIYREWCRLKHIEKQDEASLQRHASAANVQRLVSRVCDYMAAMENLRLTSVDVNEGHPAAE